MYDHLEVAAAIKACELLWFKTRRRAMRESRKHCLDGSVMHIMAHMCGCRTPVFIHGLPDWKIISSTAAGLEATIRKNAALYLELLMCHALPEKSDLKADFTQCYRRLGRDPRYREFHIKAMRTYEAWAEEPDWEIASCPFPPEIAAEAAALITRLADALVAWSLPRQNALEEALRENILSKPLKGIYAELAGLTQEPFVFGESEVTRAEFAVARPKTPPLETFLPKIAIARIDRALADYRDVMTRDPLPAWEARAPVLTSTGEALLNILDPYRAQHRSSRADHAASHE